ncbi:MAG TPA: YceH family protein [Acidimicrobiales bacterium]|nr:YceH family protein [Acidimicrobiales bacterium]
MELSPVQVRVLGCLLEKERATPDNYPLTMNALLNACNQTTNRHPVVTLNQPTVDSAIANLRAAGLVRVVFSRSNRAEKYRHVLDEVLNADDAELAVLSVLMVRGPQTSAEVRTRTERLHAFADPGEVDATLARLAGRPEPLVVRLPPAPGQKEPRWAHLLSGEVPPEAAAVPAAPTRMPRGDRIEALESALAALTEEVDRLRAEHETLAAQFRELVE